MIADLDAYRDLAVFDRTVDLSSHHSATPEFKKGAGVAGYRPRLLHNCCTVAVTRNGT